jgi:hypothetical protein
VRALGLGQSGGEEVDPGQLVGLGHLVVLPHDDDHERKQHSVGDAQDRVDEASDVVVLLSAVRGTRRCTSTSPTTAMSTGTKAVRMT